MLNETKKANQKVSALIILASSSPRRTELLLDYNIQHEVVPSKAKEISFHPDGPLALVTENAKRKAIEVAERFPDRFVLGADTIVSLKEKVFGKPADLKDAEQMLMSLSGKTHLVSTGVCVICKKNGYSEAKVESSEVSFGELSPAAIQKYFKFVNPLDKAGSYALQTKSELIVKKFTGSYSNVVGLPMELIVSWMKELLPNFKNC
ncbi:MAG: Maf family protein [Opitutales bacterium]|nr:Maf family protein [Opitutales bacterium]